MLPAGVLVLRLKLQAQYLTRLQDGAMTGCNLKEHSQGSGRGHGAELPATGASHTQLNFTGQGRFVVCRGAGPSGACYPDVLHGAPALDSWPDNFFSISSIACCLEASDGAQQIACLSCKRPAACVDCKLRVCELSVCACKCDLSMLLSYANPDL